MIEDYQSYQFKKELMAGSLRYQYHCKDIEDLSSCEVGEDYSIIKLKKYGFFSYLQVGDKTYGTYICYHMSDDEYEKLSKDDFKLYKQIAVDIQEELRNNNVK